MSKANSVIGIVSVQKKMLVHEKSRTDKKLKRVYGFRSALHIADVAAFILNRVFRPNRIFMANRSIRIKIKKYDKYDVAFYIAEVKLHTGADFECLHGFNLEKIKDTAVKKLIKKGVNENDIFFDDSFCNIIKFDTSCKDVHNGLTYAGKCQKCGISNGIDAEFLSEAYDLAAKMCGVSEEKPIKELCIKDSDLKLINSSFLSKAAGYALDIRVYTEKTDEASRFAEKLFEDLGAIAEIKRYKEYAADFSTVRPLYLIDADSGKLQFIDFILDGAEAVLVEDRRVNELSQDLNLSKNLLADIIFNVISRYNTSFCGIKKTDFCVKFKSGSRVLSE